MTHPCAVLLGCCVLILAPAVVVAQQVNGIIQGTVSDATGAMVAAAEVSTVNDSTGYTRTVNTDADGSYDFTELPPGHYHVRVTKEGFKTENQQDVELHVGATVIRGVIT